MALVVLVEACVLAVLGLLAFGLLRSHAEILRALDDLGPRRRAGSARAGNGRAGPQPVGLGHPPPTSAASDGADVAGATPSGEPVSVVVADVPHPTLLAFLSSTCHTCSGFWRTLGATGLPGGAELVVVTKGPSEEDPAHIRELAAGSRFPVVMSTGAWADYDVPVTPYFVLVDGGSGRIAGQGTGATWPQVISLLNQAADDTRARHARHAGHGRDRRSVDEQLLAAGLRPGDPRLFPSGRLEAGE